jgi:hypothetical protein
MIDDIITASRSDVHLEMLLDKARECAHVYLLAKQTYKGFEGMGELVTLGEELKEAIDKVCRYYREQNCLSGTCGYDMDSLAKELVKTDRK